MNDVIRRDVKCCASCAKSHHNLEFKPMKEPQEHAGFTWTHFALCPTTQGEVMLRFKEVTSGK